MQEFIEIANSLADEAGEIIKKYYRAPFDIESKQDESPVTIADRAVEKRLREIIENRRPQDGIWGEEFGRKDSQSGLTWVLDPIDGTKPFTIGRPTFGTLIALCNEGAPVLGVIEQPILKDRWIGVKDHVTLHNGSAVNTRTCPDIKNAVCSSTSPGMFKNMPDKNFIEEWRQSCNYIVWGGDCISYGLMASGMIDVIIEAEMQPYDYLAVVPIIEGAGGKICDWDGAALTIDSGHTVAAMGDKKLWDAVRKIVS